MGSSTFETQRVRVPNPLKPAVVGFKLFETRRFRFSNKMAGFLAGYPGTQVTLEPRSVPWARAPTRARARAWARARAPPHERGHGHGHGHGTHDRTHTRTHARTHARTSRASVHMHAILHGEVGGWPVLVETRPEVVIAKSKIVSQPMRPPCISDVVRLQIAVCVRA